MDDEPGITWIGDRRIEGVEESHLVGEFPKQQRPTIGGQLPALKIGVDRIGATPGKVEGIPVTVCHGGGLPY